MLQCRRQASSKTPEAAARQALLAGEEGPGKPLRCAGPSVMVTGQVLDLGARGGRQCCGTEMEMRPIPAGLLPPARRCVPRGTGAAA